MQSGEQGANFDNESYTVWILNHTADVDTFIESPTNIYILSINSEIVVYMIFFANKFLKSLYQSDRLLVWLTTLVSTALDNETYKTAVSQYTVLLNCMTALALLE